MGEKRLYMVGYRHVVKHIQLVRMLLTEEEADKLLEREDVVYLNIEEHFLFSPLTTPATLPDIE